MSTNQKRHSNPVSLPGVATIDLESAASTYVEDPVLPPFQVDYLSHVFSEEDVAASWKVVTKRKKAVVNGIRLENASWRTWWKRKNNLKTISPDTLNWLKDSDVTWLYGPLHSTTSWSFKPKESSTSDKLGLMHYAVSPPLSPSGLKPALKKRTISEILRKSTVREPKDIARQKPIMPRYRSESAVRTKSTSVASKQVLAAHRQPRLRFNDQVEQCIAVSEEDATGEEEEESSDDGAFILHIHKPSTRSIVKLEPTRLKTPENKKPRERRLSYEPHQPTSYDWAWDGIFTDEEQHIDGAEAESEDYFSYGMQSQYLSPGWSNEDDVEIANGVRSSVPTSAESRARLNPTHGSSLAHVLDDDELDFDAANPGVVSHLMTNVKSTVNWWSSLIFSGNVL